MSTIYLAINGDDVGQRIGGAIASDNHDELKNASEAIKQSHGMIEDWVKAAGGQVISSSGDEGIYLIPEEALKELEGIRDDYKEMSGHALTVGVGNSMSEASKALIYGKLNGKNQVVQYEPNIDDYLSEEDVEEADSTQDQDEDSDKMVDIDGEEDEQSIEDEIPSEQEITETGDESAETEVGMDDETQDDPDKDKPNKKDIDSTQVSEDFTSPEEEIDSNQSPSEEDWEEEERKGEEEEGFPEGIDGKSEDDDGKSEDDDGIEDLNEEDVVPQNDENNTPMPSEDGEETESVYDELAPKTGKEMDDDQPEDESDGYNHNDALADMIHGDMEGQSPEDDENNQEADEQGLKDDIATALSTFKQNKEHLENARTSAPELYEAMVVMLRSMIDMAKKLGYTPEQDMQAMEAEDQLNDQFPDAQQESVEEDDQDEDSKDDMKGKFAAKKQ